MEVIIMHTHTTDTNYIDTTKQHIFYIVRRRPSVGVEFVTNRLGLLNNDHRVALISSLDINAALMSILKMHNYQDQMVCRTAERLWKLFNKKLHSRHKGNNIKNYTCIIGTQHYDTEITTISLCGRPTTVQKRRRNNRMDTPFQIGAYSNMSEMQKENVRQFLSQSFKRLLEILKDVAHILCVRCQM